MRITPDAHEKLTGFLKDYEGGVVRIAQLTTGGGCCGSQLMLGATLDDAYNDVDDVVYSVDGITVVVDKVLHASLEKVEIGFDEEKCICVSCVR